MRTFLALCFIALPLFGKEESVTDRLSDAGDVFSELMNTKDKSLPQDLLDKAECIVVSRA